eukprot:8010851-Lingulodinium_polyedra.AAC.1
MARALSAREGGRKPCRGPWCTIHAASRSSWRSCSAVLPASRSPLRWAPSHGRTTLPLSRAQASR